MNAHTRAIKTTALALVAICLSAIAITAGPVDAVSWHAASHDLASGAVCATPVVATASAPQMLDENECPETSTVIRGGHEVEGQLYDLDCIGIGIPFPSIFGSGGCEDCFCKYYGTTPNGFTWFWHESNTGCEWTPPIWIIT